MTSNIRVTNHPVRLLRDARGIYGIGCETGDWQGALLLRPDRLGEGDTRRAALQMIIGGFRRGPFRNTLEELFRKAIHGAMLRRAGLSWPPEQCWWSTDPAQQDRNRRRYHGTRVASLAVVNRFLAEAFPVADQDALRQARRFPIHTRNAVYHYAAGSRRALQLVEAFPTIALVLSGSYHGHATETVRELVERGVSLRRVAVMLEIPWAFKHVKPASARFALSCLDLNERLVHAYLPDSAAGQKVWLQSVAYANRTSRGFGQWVAQHVADIGRPTEQAVYIITDVADWVRASLSGDKFAVRRFEPTMSIETVRTLSHEWHEAVARDRDSSGAPFPRPWYAAGPVGEFEFVPIDNRADLYREGQAMHHCVASYADQVQADQVYIFSVRKDGERLATIALGRTPEGPGLLQVRGPCNAEVPPRVMAATRKWLRALPQLPPPKPEYPQPVAEFPARSTAIADAHRCGAQACASGMSRRALPAEYCTAERACEALAWIKGYDGERLPPPCDVGDAIEQAHRRGKEAKKAGHQRKALPPEYRTPDRTKEGLAWMAGYDGQPSLLDDEPIPCPW
jgi:PcfJ-like protein